MASLRDVAEKTADQLEELVDEMRAELGGNSVDFDELASIADQISERADEFAEAFSNINETLLARLDGQKERSRKDRAEGGRPEKERAQAETG
jgi:ABC-type transporter Mla subunit MlaD